MIESASAESCSMQVVTDYKLEYVDHSYDVPPITTSATDPYTGKVTTSTEPGHHVDNKTVIATIKNPPDAFYYNFRYKGHYQNETQWSYYPYTPSNYEVHGWGSLPQFLVSSSDYTSIELFFLPKIPQGGSIDVQVQALYGNFSQQHESSIGAMMLGYDEIFNFYFEGQAGNWSSTQTLSVPDTSSSPSSNPTSSPSVPEFPVLAILPLFVAIPLITTILLRKKKSQRVITE